MKKKSTSASTKKKISAGYEISSITHQVNVAKKSGGGGGEKKLKKWGSDGL